MIVLIWAAIKPEGNPLILICSLPIILPMIFVYFQIGVFTKKNNNSPKIDAIKSKYQPISRKKENNQPHFDQILFSNKNQINNEIHENKTNSNKEVNESIPPKKTLSHFRAKLLLGEEADQKRKRVLEFIASKPVRKYWDGPGIYLIANTITGDGYVGKTRGLSTRFSEHLGSFKDHNKRDTRSAIDKWVWDGNDPNILMMFVLEQPPRKLNYYQLELSQWLSEREAFWVDQYGTYNFKRGG